MAISEKVPLAVDTSRLSMEPKLNTALNFENSLLVISARDVLRKSMRPFWAKAKRALMARIRSKDSFFIFSL